ncbi:hypothetical protein OnM2_039084 [Erysiphe neolycopersici]|uniref:Uncharacterized protein n=1 Tax=Erysiphe neolycopersici TaxID=212602 RepID=A0A420HWK0_9PEZI|nr:hypothetical protein OnM2_039084 [Erysiphe neolycopersici]
MRPKSQAAANLNRRGEVELMGGGSSDSSVFPGEIAERSDMDCFAFTIENLFESENAFCYANWSLTR